MMSSVELALQSERTYKTVVENANTFITKFRAKITSMCDNLICFEKPRTELLHNSINSFVVFEMSAEMNNKYDVGNFAKLLETFNPDTEVTLVSTYLKKEMPSVGQPKFDFVEFKPTGKLDFRSLTPEQSREPSRNVADVLADNSLTMKELDLIIGATLSKIFSNTQA